MTRPGHVYGPVQAWQRLATKVLHRSPWFELREDEVMQPNGDKGTYVHVVAPASVTVLAIGHDDQVVLTRQWIYTHGGTEWRLPSGAVENSDASPVDAARRELAEETGLRAEHWEQIGQIHGADSLSNQIDHIFLASGLNQGCASLGPGEVDLRVRTLPFSNALELIYRGELPHAGSAHALLTTALHRAEISTVDDDLATCATRQGAARERGRPPMSQPAAHAVQLA